MHILIDASNIRDGGGITHLRELLSAADPLFYGFTKVTVWAGQYTLDQLPKKKWLIGKIHKFLNKSLPYRLFWQNLLLPKKLNSSVDLFFVPGGSYSGNFKRCVVMQQNLLPFERGEINRFPRGKQRLRLELLRIMQKLTFKKCKNIIALSQYAKDRLKDRVNLSDKKVSIIPHGVSAKFHKRKKLAKNNSDVFKVLYVSRVEYYKHQWNVVSAVAKLRARALPIEFDFVGHAYGRLRKKSLDEINKSDSGQVSICYHDEVSHNTLPAYYQKADAFVFSSSCETFGAVLVEAMVAGLPIVCSESSVMPEVVGDSGLYFNPESPNDIADKLEALYKDVDLQHMLAESAYARSKLWTWEKCAKDTFEVLRAAIP